MQCRDIGHRLPRRMFSMPTRQNERVYSYSFPGIHDPSSAYSSLTKPEARPCVGRKKSHLYLVWGIHCPERGSRGCAMIPFLSVSYTYLIFDSKRTSQEPPGHLVSLACYVTFPLFPFTPLEKRSLQ